MFVFSDPFQNWGRCQSTCCCLDGKRQGEKKATIIFFLQKIVQFFNQKSVQFFSSKMVQFFIQKSVQFFSSKNGTIFYSKISSIFFFKKNYYNFSSKNSKKNSSKNSTIFLASGGDQRHDCCGLLAWGKATLHFLLQLNLLEGWCS